jgi:hypothetical protein
MNHQQTRQNIQWHWLGNIGTNAICPIALSAHFASIGGIEKELLFLSYFG